MNLPFSRRHNEAFGLVAWLEQTRVVLPLKAVDVAFSVSGDLAEVSLDQVFHQTAGRPLDVTYTFPLPAGAAVFRCELIVNDRVIQARVEEQARAKEIARTMKAAGRRTGLVEVERDNLFTLSLGNVQPDDLIIVRFAWFQVLDHLQDAKSLSIPFTPGVRYIPGNPLLRSNRGKGTQDDTDQVPDASRISPPRINELHPDAALISLTGKLDGRFVDEDSVSSATHPVVVRLEAETLSVTLPRNGSVPDRDFVLRWNERAVKALDLKSVCCVDEEATYAVVRLDAPADAPVADQQSRDYYFLVDRSGSMRGAKWTCTAQALQAFVNELGELDRVGITLFEGSFQDFAEGPLPVLELRSDPAFQCLETLGVAGGTNLHPALEHVLQQISTHSKERNPVVIIITDGQVGNESSVVDALRSHRDVTLHTFGIDSAVNDAFLKQMAARHRGACVLMTPNDDIQGAVSRLGNRLRRPVLTDLVVPSGWEATCACQPDIHAGEHILVALKGPRQTRALELSGKLADQSVRAFRFDLDPQPVATPRLLWARQEIDRCLGEGRDKDAIQLAIRHNLICRGTAFIAYDMEEKVAVAAEEIYQPSMDLADSYRSMCAAAPAPAGEMRRRVASSAPMAFQESFASAASASSSSVGRPLWLDFLKKQARYLKENAKLEEIRARYASESGRALTIQVQTLAETWSKEAIALPFLKTPAGQVLVSVLGHWALGDARRFALLMTLKKDIAGTDYKLLFYKFILKAFIQQQINEPALVKDLFWLVDELP